MSKWTLAQWATAIFIVLIGVAACVVVGFAWRMGVEPSAPVEMAEPTPTDWLPPGGTLTPRPAISECTPNATTAARWDAVETRVYVLERAAQDAAAILAEAYGIATPLATYTPGPSPTPGPEQTEPARPTWTPEAFVTPTATPTQVALCHACDVSSSPRYNCPSGYWCKQCAGGRWTCVRNESPSADCQLCAAASMPVESPIWSLPEWSAVGLMTFYTDTITSSGEVFMPDGLTCAVDESVYGMLEGLTLRITNLVDGRWVLVYVNDQGRLYSADPIKGYRVVVDVPYAIAKRIGDANTTLVRVAVEQGDLTSVQKVVQ
jgi:hypothetical protein